MKITAQEEYGLRCLLRLARATDASLTLHEIADAEGLSLAHVAKLMSVMRQAGLLDSVRGRAGGYRLAQAPEGICPGSLLFILGEPLFHQAAFYPKNAGLAPDGHCFQPRTCTLKTRC